MPVLTIRSNFLSTFWAYCLNSERIGRNKNHYMCLSTKDWEILHQILLFFNKTMYYKEIVVVKINGQLDRGHRIVDTSPMVRLYQVRQPLMPPILCISEQRARKLHQYFHTHSLSVIFKLAQPHLSLYITHNMRFALILIFFFSFYGCVNCNFHMMFSL